MVKHIVMFKFFENAEGRTKKENVEIAANMLKEANTYSAGFGK